MSNINSNKTMIEFITEHVNNNSPKFKLGDIVVSKITGLPNIGTVVSMEMAPLYVLTHQKSVNFSRWDNLFSEWRKKYVYTLAFNEAVRTINLDEYNEINNKYPDLIPYENYPKFNFIEYVEDDLELFE